MRTLILLRHGKAVREHEAPSDEARPLTDRGRRDATQAGAEMAAARLAPTRALISTAQRTRDTADAALAALGAVAKTYASDLYMAGPETIWDAFQASPDDVVLVIGHNPGLSELTALLIDQAHDGSRLARELSDGLSTSAFAAFEIAGDTMEAAAPRLLSGWRPPRA